mgnify:CR=1 FL=1
MKKLFDFNNDGEVDLTEQIIGCELLMSDAEEADELSLDASDAIFDEYGDDAVLTELYSGLDSEFENIKKERDMTVNEYQKLALSTMNPKLNRNDVLINSAMGLCGEAGEVIDIVKKWSPMGMSLTGRSL